MRKVNMSILAILLFTSILSINGCVSDNTSLKINNSLPYSKITYYNDSFDKLREDLWTKASLVNEAQMNNLKLADMRIQEGKLVVETKTGGFSKGGLGSKFVLRGDFDIQVDCQINFLEGLHDMDQRVVFLVFDKSKEIEELDLVLIGLVKKRRKANGVIFSAARVTGKYKLGRWFLIGNFHGTMRIVRIGGKINTLYKKSGAQSWKNLDAHNFTTKDVTLSFQVANFKGKQASIEATAPITVTFDNFKINAAQVIIEEDI